MEKALGVPGQAHPDTAEPLDNLVTAVPVVPAVPVLPFPAAAWRRSSAPSTREPGKTPPDEERLSLRVRSVRCRPDVSSVVEQSPGSHRQTSYPNRGATRAKTERHQSALVPPLSYATRQARAGSQRTSGHAPQQTTQHFCAPQAATWVHRLTRQRFPPHSLKRPTIPDAFEAQRCRDGRLTRKGLPKAGVCVCQVLHAAACLQRELWPTWRLCPQRGRLTTILGRCRRNHLYVSPRRNVLWRLLRHPAMTAGWQQTWRTHHTTSVADAFCRAWPSFCSGRQNRVDPLCPLLRRPAQDSRDRLRTHTSF